MSGATWRCIAIVAAALVAVACPGCISNPLEDEAAAAKEAVAIPDGLSFPPLEPVTRIKSEPLPEGFWAPLVNGKKEDLEWPGAAPDEPSPIESRRPAAPASPSGSGKSAESPEPEPDPGSAPGPKPTANRGGDGKGARAGPGAVAAGAKTGSTTKAPPASGGDPPPAPGTPPEPEPAPSPVATGGSDGRPSAVDREPSKVGSGDPASKSEGGKEPIAASKPAEPEKSAPAAAPAGTEEEPTGFSIWMPAAGTTSLLSLCLIGLVTVRRNRFRRELMDLFGVEWRGRVPLSQLRGFVQAHRGLNERLKSGLAYMESRRREDDASGDPDLRRLNYLVRSIDQRRRHILNDIKQLAILNSGSETSLEKALRIHAARMELLDASDDLMQGLRHVQALAKS